MKLLLLLFTICVCFPQESNYRIRSDYDRFTDKTTVSVGFFHPIKGTNLTALYQYKGHGDRIQPPQRILFRFDIVGPSPLPSDIHTLYVIADNRRLQFEREVDDLGDPHLIHIVISFTEFERVLAAQHIEMRLGQIELTLTDDDVKALRDFMPKKVSQ